MNPDRSLPLLGGLTPRAFLREYWQKKPLLIRGAIPDLVAPLTRGEVLTLAAREDAESRLVEGRGKKWTLTHGPIGARKFGELKSKTTPWTVLVQDVQHHSYEAHDLLAKFGFISNARIDDLMVSYAVDGGGVGPHVDSYDVFLLQGTGKRKWQISRQGDLSLEAGLPLKILKRFRVEDEFVLETGDMLYLPPQVAHHGVAIGDCLTWSIGFRAPNYQELGEFLLDASRDSFTFPGQYSDPSMKPTRFPGIVDTQMQRSLLRVMRQVAKSVRNERHLTHALGCFLTAPKPHVFLPQPEDHWEQGPFAREVQSRGVRLTLPTRMLRCSGEFFVNGEHLPCPSNVEDALFELANSRMLRPASVGQNTTRVRAPFNQTLCRILHQLHETGAIEFAPIEHGGKNG